MNDVVNGIENDGGMRLVSEGFVRGIEGRLGEVGGNLVMLGDKMSLLEVELVKLGEDMSRLLDERNFLENLLKFYKI